MGCWGYFLDDPLKRTEPIIPGTAEKNDRIRSTVTLGKKLIIIGCALEGCSLNCTPNDPMRFLKIGFFYKVGSEPTSKKNYFKVGHGQTQ